MFPGCVREYLTYGFVTQTFVEKVEVPRIKAAALTRLAPRLTR